jgi:O-glycosyl hydrolase
MVLNGSYRSSRFTTEALEPRLFLSTATVSVNPDSTFQTIDGFGAAMITWRRPNEYRQAAFYDMLVNDLGATMARTAIWPMFEAENDDADPNHVNWDGFDFDSLNYAMDFFQRLKERGVDQFMATVWTPPYWMKTNRSFYHAGMLRGDMREEFAEYLTAVSLAADQQWGIQLNGISIQNEPYFVTGYESAAYNPWQIRETVRAVQRKFDAEGIDTPILIPEDLAVADRMLWYVQPTMNDPETRNFEGHFLGHGFLGTNNWNTLRNNYAPYGRKFWQTETSSQPATWNGALSLGEEIHQTLALGDASAYLYWQFSDSAGSSAFALMNDGVPNPKYFAAKQYYRYIRPGAERVAATSTNSSLLVSSYLHPDTDAATTVMVNKNADATDVTLNLPAGPGNYRMIVSSSTQNAVDLGEVAPGTTVSIPPQSIVTFYSGPDLVTQTGGGGNHLPIVTLKDTGRAHDLQEAAMEGSLTTVQGLLAGGANVNVASSDGWTALHSGVSSVYWDGARVVQELLNAGANVNAATTDGWTPLHAAAANTTTRFGVSYSIPVEQLQLLIDAGANVNAIDIHGRTPLHYAAMQGKMNDMSQDESVVEALIAAGADVNVVDNDGKIALDYATRESYESIRQALLNAGQDVTLPTANILPVIPDPRTDAVSSITIQFSERITGFDLPDLQLTRDGGGNVIGGNVTLTSNSDKTIWTLNNLGNLTGAPGEYQLRLVAAGANIRDVNGNLLAGSVTETWNNVSAQSTITRNVVEDAYVRDGSYAAINYGNDPEIQVKRSNSGGFAREAYVKVDLRNLTDVTEATLRLYGRLSASANTNMPTAVYGVTNTSWIETGLKWNNKPSATGNALATTNVPDNVPRWYEWDVTAFLRQQKAAGASFASLVLRNTLFSSTYTIFSSSEAMANRPHLRITQTPADSTPPAVASVVINDGAAQRSNLSSITIRFSEPTNFDDWMDSGTIDDQIKLYNSADPNLPLTWLDETRFSWDATNYAVTIDLTVDGFGGSDVTHLENGRYEVQITTASILDPTGNALADADGTADGKYRIAQSTSAAAPNIFRLGGDLDGDADVDLSDLSVLSAHYGTLDPLGDADGDGDVDLSDLGLLSANYGGSI